MINGIGRLKQVDFESIYHWDIISTRPIMHGHETLIAIMDAFDRDYTSCVFSPFSSTAASNLLS